MKTEDDRDDRLRSVSQYHAHELLLDDINRETALQRVRAKAPGYSPERYESELDEALALSERHRDRTRRRRRRMIEKARDEYLLDAVFTLRYYNRRFSGHAGEYRMGQIDIHGALGDLYTTADLDDAVMKADALINDGLQAPFGDFDKPEQSKRVLRSAHPGFNERNLSDAMFWGYHYSR